MLTRYAALVLLAAGLAACAEPTQPNDGAPATDARLSSSTELSALIDGPGYIRPNQECGYFADVEGGVTPYTYTWSAVSATGTVPSWDPSTYLVTSSASLFYVKLKVTDAVGAVDSTQVAAHTATWAPEVCLQ